MGEGNVFTGVCHSVHRGRVYPRSTPLVDSRYQTVMYLKLYDQSVKFLLVDLIGLLYDDMLDDENPTIKEAARRLPEALTVERGWRRYRALDLSCKKIILPEEEWTTYEEVR